MSGNTSLIGLVRRGYSASGGAEAYLKRLGEGFVRQGLAPVLFTTPEWPEAQWPHGRIVRLNGRSPLRFADEMEAVREKTPVDLLFSLERIHACDIYRAGDGVHCAWLARRATFEKPWQRLLRRWNPKHPEIVRLEKELLDDRRAERVIANSQMVKAEIVDAYNYRPDRIDVIRNGVPVADFRFDVSLREERRRELQLEPDELALLFVGSGWERKGLRFAVAALPAVKSRKVRLIVAGRGKNEEFSAANLTFLGEIENLRATYAAADVFILPTIYDPFSNACLEALASGLPVITTRSNGFSEIIENKIHGSIVDRADDIESLGKAIELWSDPAWRSAARPSILKRAAEYDISRNVERTIALVTQAAEAAARSGKILKT